MIEEKVILQVLSEQQEEVKNYSVKQWGARQEEDLFEFDSPLAQVVIGVRRSGKSTLCHKVLQSRGIGYAYANLDDDRLARMEVEDLNTMLSCLYMLYGTDFKYLFLDEIQNVEGWHLFVNRLLRTGVHVFLTGSNARLLSSELATHLTGRYNEIRLFPFSFAEFCQYRKVQTNGVTTKEEAELKRAFYDYIHEGGFPEILLTRNKRGYVQCLLEAILNKDIKNRFKVRDIDALQKIATHLINNACQVVNYDELSKELNLSDKTVKKYVDYLRQAFLILLLPKHSFKSKERISGEKAYMVDTGLENNRDYSMAGENVGWRLENVVYVELLRRCSKQFYDVYYYRPTARQKEVDFVVCNQNKAIGLIQVAYEIENQKTLERETSALVKAADALHCDNLKLIAFADRRAIVTEGKTIQIISAIEWLVNESIL